MKDIIAESVVSVFFMHCISRFGSPKTITTYQDSQLESTLFKALANPVGAKRIHTAPYHSTSNELITRWHRSLEACVKRYRSVVHQGRHQDLSSRMTLPMTLGMHRELLANDNMPADLQIFGGKIREQMRELRPTPTAHRVKPRMFILKNLYTCSHVFLRTDATKSPLQPPYTEPY
jgi:transposase InsO family protein